MKESSKMLLAFVAIAIVCTYAFIGGYYYKAAKVCEAQRLSELSQTPVPCSELSETSKIVVTQINDWVEPEPFPYKYEIWVTGDEDLGMAFPWEPCSLLGLKLPVNRWEQLTSYVIEEDLLPFDGTTIHDGVIKIRGSLMPDPWDYRNEIYCRLRQQYFEELWCPGLTVRPKRFF